MGKKVNVIIEMNPEAYYVGTVPELRGCHTQAKSLDTLMKRMREAIELCLELSPEQEIRILPSRHREHLSSITANCGSLWFGME